MEILILKDNSGRNYVVDNPKCFQKHLLEFHAYNGEADNSIHEENGFHFIVTSEMLEKVTSLINKLD